MIPVETVKDFITRSENFMNDGVIVQDEDGDYSVIPDAYLNDISYTGPRKVVVSGGRELAAQIRSDYNAEDLDNLSDDDWGNIAEFVNGWIQ